MIDVNKYLSNKLDVEFVSELDINNRMGTIVSVEEVIIQDKQTKKDKELIELKINFPLLEEVRSILPNQKSLKNLKEAFGSKANEWVTKQVVPKTHMFPNKMVGVLLDGVK